ncbi:unnamed protein product [Pocillopora meandrina]|uniref:Uncharacterized protein n=1 Tax=Pocillopora meandrina TaxID=46732 RepID=A0AAU9VPV0_9CNID|nr:unnamed protein product [Pocillopora meandrina]
MRFEAKHQYFKDLKKILNFKNICLSLSNHHQKKAAMNCSAGSIFKGNEYGPVQHPKGEEFTFFREFEPTSKQIHLKEIEDTDISAMHFNRGGWRWIFTEQRSRYPPLTTDTKVNSYCSVY